ncbi:hypothetical protein FOA52_000539 [Chlamydomonas sp. UWO 241]|nr:hypothetical protein FOA52_000539 [Chlamydomonas sp. UWO 241]
MDPIAARIGQRWPGREAEASRIAALSSGHSVPDFFVYGVPSTGKTSVVRAVLAATPGGRRVAYVQVTETLKPKQLLSNIYTQLHGYKRKHSEGYAGLSIDSVADFFKALPAVCKPGDRTSLVVLDDAHWLSRGPLLRALLQARQLSGGASVAFVLVSQQAWGCGEFEDLPHVPAIHFGAYGQTAMVETLVRMRAEQAPGAEAADEAMGLGPSVCRAFCEHVVTTFQDMTRDLLDFVTLASAVWPAYVEPVTSGKVAPCDHSDEQLLRKLYTKAFVGTLQAVHRAYEPGMRVLPPGTLGGGGGGSGSGRRQGEQLLELPEVTRLLVVAAYIASYNKPTLDRQIFDVKTKSGRLHGSRAAMASDRQVEAAREARLKGPHAFPLQRLLACLGYLQAGRDAVGIDEEVDLEGPTRPDAAAASDDDDGPPAINLFEGGGGGAGGPLVRAALPWWRRGGGAKARGLGGSLVESADVQVHLTTLSTMQLLSRAESEAVDPLDGAKYTCHVDEGYAGALAESLGLRLTDYIKYA